MYAQAGLQAADIAVKAMAALGISGTEAIGRLASGTGSR
jgi:hypothetical protein